MPLDLEVYVPGGGQLDLSLEPSSSIKDVKRAVKASKGIAMHLQSLTTANRRLYDTDQLSDIPHDGKLRLNLMRRTPDQVLWLRLVETEDGLTRLDEAPDVIRADQEVMLAAASRNPDSLRHAHQKLLGSSEFMLTAAARNQECLRWASQSLWSDGEFVLRALQFSWRHLFRAHEELRSDRDFMLKAVLMNRWALQCATDDLKADENFLMLTLTRGRRDFVMDHMSFDGRGLRRARDLRKDRDVVRVAVNSKGTALQYAAPELQADRDIVMDAVTNDAEALQWAAPALQGDRGIVTTALQQNLRAARWASSDLMADEEVKALVEERMKQKTMKGRSRSASRLRSAKAFSRQVSSPALQQAKSSDVPLIAHKSTRPHSAAATRQSRPRAHFGVSIGVPHSQSRA